MGLFFLCQKYSKHDQNIGQVHATLGVILTPKEKGMGGTSDMGYGMDNIEIKE